MYLHTICGKGTTLLVGCYKKLFFFLPLLGFVVNTKGQISFELFSSSEFATQEVIWDKHLYDSSKWSIFNYSRFQINYDSQTNNDFFTYNTINYQIVNNFSGAIGGFITKEGFTPVFALNYFKVKDNFYFNIFPSIELKANPFFELFFMTQIRPKINKNWHLFSQIISISNFNFSQHRFSQLLVRLGLEREIFQFGIGSNANLFRVVENEDVKQVFSNNLGFFIRTELGYPRK